MSEASYRTFVVYVEDKPGVLNRVASLFRRRNFNIHSLNVGNTNEAGVSRMTIVIESDLDKAKRIESNLYKLVNVLWVDDITDLATIDIALALIKVTARPERRTELLQVASVFNARTVDMSLDTMTFEITDSQTRIDAFLAVLKPFGVEEMVQTGTVSMMRGSVAPRPGHPTVNARPVVAAE
ncbi:MAG: acetolactate synthase small subunit [Sandaracinaceae bacterium]|nr:acetolactate synthase small subunit [Sandaracinaceae bacterium]MBK7777734.1 acetolactate synthase small subunit [Sandaracinaceae bacterium]MBK8410646.1 acetolactate synthase small subunit [Sandaracinaceae bacterium]